jgi:subtilase family serine protease
VQWAHSIAPGAKIVVVASAGQDSEDFQDAISYITNHNLGKLGHILHSTSELAAIDFQDRF